MSSTPATGDSGWVSAVLALEEFFPPSLYVRFRLALTGCRSVGLVFIRPRITTFLGGKLRVVKCSVVRVKGDNVLLDRFKRDNCEIALFAFGRRMIFGSPSGSSISEAADRNGELGGGARDDNETDERRLRKCASSATGPMGDVGTVDVLAGPPGLYGKSSTSPSSIL